MRATVSRVALGVIMMVMVPSRLMADDVIAKNLAVAKEAYQASMKEAHIPLIKFLEHVDAKAREKSDLDMVNALQKERMALENQGIIPKRLTVAERDKDAEKARKAMLDKYRIASSRAKTAMIDAYRKAIKDNLTVKNDVAANLVKAEMNDFQQNPASSGPRIGAAPALKARVVRGNWLIEGEELVQNDTNPRAVLVFGDPTWSNYDLKVRVKFAQVKHGSLVFLNYKDESNFQCYFLGGFGNSYHGSAAFVNGDNVKAPQDKTLKPGAVELNRWYQLGVQVRGPEVTCYLDGLPWFYFLEPRLSQGLIGLGSHASSVRFRDLQISTIDGITIFRGLPELPPK